MVFKALLVIVAVFVVLFLVRVLRGTLPKM
jgi:hypothetical protein